MKITKKTVLAAAVLSLLCLAGCKPGKALLPSISGKSGEIVVVMDKAWWDSAPGDSVRAVLGTDCPYFVMPEARYSLINVTPANFGDLFKVHRNILTFKTDSETDSCLVRIHHDVWAQPQCVIQVCGNGIEEATRAFCEGSATIISGFEQAERDRIVSNARTYEQTDIFPKVAQKFGGSLHFPSGYTLRKINDNFAWIEYGTRVYTQCIFIYKYPARDDCFSEQNLVRERDSIMKAEVPGPREGSYVYTSQEVMKPSVEFIRYKGRRFAQMRGWWETEGDYMGGPFVSHCFYSPDGKEIICAEAFLYQPKENKRLLFHQIESILYSWEWKE